MIANSPDFFPKTVSNPLRLAVLVPHGNIRASAEQRRRVFLDEYGAAAFQLPLVAPFAILSRPLDYEELRAAARNLRCLLSRDGRACGIFAPSFGAVPVTSSLTLFGITLELPMPLLPAASLPHPVKPLLCLALLPCTARLEHYPFFPAFPSIRSGALANMVIRFHSGGNGFDWKIGKLAWLPKQPKE